MSEKPRSQVLTAMEFDEYPVYQGRDLGVRYSPSKTAFRLWSPAADAVRVKFYSEGAGGEPREIHSLHPDVAGTWYLELMGDRQGMYYAFQVMAGGQWLPETPGPYARAVGVNGLRGFIADLTSTDPEGWDEDKAPPLESYNDIIIYEVHVRDMSMHPASGIQHKGKFLGLAESGTRTPGGSRTGLDHIEELGVTHVHILPMFDYRSIDETRLEENHYNWGYEPQNYNVPEGSYATDPYDPLVRIRELKTMIKAMHDKGLRVIMDVVYNHTGFGDASTLNMSLSAPGYYYRFNEDGTPSDASACGNETASERPMMRKFILESVEYWVREYHVDGFRFDLMGIHDVETMNAVSERVRQIDPSIFVYGEGWKAGSSPLPDEQLALKRNVPMLRHVAAFSDEVRDGIKGAWNDWEAPGFVSGNLERVEGVKFGIVGGVSHPQINYTDIKESEAPWALNADQCIVYVSCHDNHTLYDKLKIVNPNAPEEEILGMHVLANTIILTSQGIPFLHAGVDFVRTKQGVENSYRSPDEINRMDWLRKEEHKGIFGFYKALIALRKQHPLFRLNTRAEIAQRIRFIEEAPDHVIAYTIDGEGTDDLWSSAAFIFNGGSDKALLDLNDGGWTVVLDGTTVDETGIRQLAGRSVVVPPRSALILARW